MNTFQKKTKLKQSEKNLREEVSKKILDPFNKTVRDLTTDFSLKVVSCLENPKYDTMEAYKCKRTVEEEFLRRQDYLKFYAKRLDNEVKVCLGGCRDDMLNELWVCYDTCLTRFSGYLNTLDSTL